MQPRNVNVLQGGGYVPGLQQNNHRTPAQQAQAQSMVPQPTPTFIQQRGQSSFAFAGGLGQHQPSTPLQQQQQQQLPSQQQQHQTNGTSNTLLPHLAQTPSLGTAPSTSSASEVGLDPNDFPALGSTPANNNNSTNGNNGNSGGSATTSYASQAGTGVPLGGAGGTVAGAGGISGAVGAAGNASQSRDFTPDDFPALGGQTQNQSSASHPPQNQDNHPHPPGLNGFQHTDHSQQHRQNLLGALGGVPQGTPGMLNLGPTQTRNVHPGFQQGQTEVEKQQQRVSLLDENRFLYTHVASPISSTFFFCVRVTLG